MAAEKLFGILNINKPVGATSRDVVNQVQRATRPAKVGHAGTLDPIASGVLVVCVGPATRLIQYVQNQPKTYEAKFLIGHTSASADIEEPVHTLDAPYVPDDIDWQRVFPDFLGEIEQVPPIYSAVKVDGKRAYKLAREGKEVEIQPRPVIIHQLEMLRYEYPVLEVRIRCGSGTYIRSLGRDMARKLGTDAVMSELVRTAVGEFTLEKSISLEDATLPLPKLLQSPELAVTDLPPLEVTIDETERLHNGLTIERSLPADPREFAVFHEARLVAIAKCVHPGLVRAVRNFKLNVPQ